MVGSHGAVVLIQTVWAAGRGYGSFRWNNKLPGRLPRTLGGDGENSIPLCGQDRMVLRNESRMFGGDRVCSTPIPLSGVLRI